MSAPPQPITTVIFDFDGVLADTERLHLHAFQQVFGVCGWQLDEATYFDRYLGYDDRGLVVAFDQDQALHLGREAIEELVAEKSRVFAERIAVGEVLFPGARECVERLAGRFALGIASGALKHEIVTILDGSGLLSHFPVIVAADDVSSCKPSPEPYLTAAQRLGVLPEECAAVEDSLPGLSAARTAGMRTVGITTTSPRPLLTIADCVIDRLDELSPELLGALGPGRAV